jgi:D-hydroxyproline dehydrogenase subunit alpha
MPERVALTIDGKPSSAPAGVTVAAALENAGVRASRSSVAGEPRGVLCGMGICFECRVAIDGVPHRRACMELVRGGMRVETCHPPLDTRAPTLDSRREALDCDVAVVGAGPAGVAAACRAAESGARTVVLDEGLAGGGQIYRHLPSGAAPEAARPWFERLARSGAVALAGASVFDAVAHDDGWQLSAETAAGARNVRARRVVLATGARELFLPFPGWTLPGVMGAGGAQALAKSGAALGGRTAVVAGSGPLLLPVAATLAKMGVDMPLVAEQAGMAALAQFTTVLAGFPGKLLEAARYRAAFFDTPYRTGTWVAEARGNGRLESLVLTDGAARFEVPCDLAAIGYGLVPNTELARLLGCAMRGGAVAVWVDERQQTSVAGIYCAGEPCGVAGVDVAIAEGQIAGLAAVDRLDEVSGWSTLATQRARGRRLATAMNRAFRPRRELGGLVRPDTIVCRCEDASFASLAACGSARESKLASRAGMGPCQGRVCGPALAFLFGWDSDTVRPPARPALVGNLVAPE